MDGIRLGLIARCEAGLSRGLAAQTHTLFTHLQPTRTLLILMEGDQAIYPQDPSQFSSSSHLTDHQVIAVPRSKLTEGTFRAWARGLDVILTAETFYLPTAPDIARQLGVPTILIGNREFLAWATKSPPPFPDLFISPSTWDLAIWPVPTVHLPTPVDRTRFPFTLRTHARAFLHAAGHAAIGDRAGTRDVAKAARRLPSTIRLIVRAQDSIADLFSTARCQVEAHYATNLPDARDLYADADVLIAPRRYGGQSLLLQDALSLGMPVIALQREPESSILPPSTLVRANPWMSLRMPGGQITCYQCAPGNLAFRIKELAATPSLVEAASRAADAYAESISWTQLKPQWESVLTQVANHQKEVTVGEVVPQRSA